MFIDKLITLGSIIEQAEILAEDEGIDLGSATVEICLPEYDFALVPDRLEFDYDNGQVTFVLDPDGAGEAFAYSRIPDLVENGSGYVSPEFVACWRMAGEYDVYDIDAVSEAGETDPNLCVLRIV